MKPIRFLVKPTSNGLFDKINDEFIGINDVIDVSINNTPLRVQYLFQLPQSGLVKADLALVLSDNPVVDKELIDEYVTGLASLNASLITVGFIMQGPDSESFLLEAGNDLFVGEDFYQTSVLSIDDGRLTCDLIDAQLVDPIIIYNERGPIDQLYKTLEFNLPSLGRGY